MDQDEARKLVEQLRATVQMKDHLLQMVSHEMRTPLLSIANFSTTMLTAWDVIEDEDKRSYLGIIGDQAQRLSRLVGDLLAVARLEAGRLRTMRERVELRELANQTVAELMPDASDVTVECEDDVLALADRDHVKQILINFVTNALKYGQAPIVVRAAEESDDAVRLWVADAGTGVSEDFEPHLFEKFSQASDEQQRVGTGLGLAIVEGLADAQGGKAWFERGDTHVRFGVTLPRG